MAARLRTKHQIEVRSKIQASQLINRLTDHALGQIDLTTTQVKAIEILLRKCVPDLSSVEHQGEVTHNYVARTPNVIEDSEQWAQRYQPTTH